MSTVTLPRPCFFFCSSGFLMCFGAKEGYLENASGMNEGYPSPDQLPPHPPPAGVSPQAAFLGMLVTIVFIFVSV